MTKPDLLTLPSFVKGYVEHVKDLDVMEALTTSAKHTQQLVSGLPEEMGKYRYQPEKWSIKEVLCHLMDAERIFTYRALRFARNDKTNLHGFEENDYAPQANAESRTLDELRIEMQNLRTSAIDLFKSFTPEMLMRSGHANNTEISVLNLGYVIAGHETHHRKILLERYLK